MLKNMSWREAAAASRAAEGRSAEPSAAAPAPASAPSVTEPAPKPAHTSRKRPRQLEQSTASELSMQAVGKALSKASAATVPTVAKAPESERPQRSRARQLLAPLSGLQLSDFPEWTTEVLVPQKGGTTAWAQVVGHVSRASGEYLSVQHGG